MKKLTKRLLGVGMTLVMLLALAACGDGGKSGGFSEVGTWELTDVLIRTIDQGKLSAGANSTITLYSDNTFVLTCARNTYYSSDGGETFNPVSYSGALIRGTYEITNDDAELGEKTMKVTKISRIVKGNYDSDASATDADKELMANNELVGREIFLGSDGKMSEIIDIVWFTEIGKEE